MRKTPKIFLIVCVFALAVTGTLFFLREKSPSKPVTTPRSSSSRPASTQSNDIWSVGDTWTVVVRQDAGAITPDGTKSISKVPFRFEVVSAPKNAKGAWKIHIAQDGAEGPFAKGWFLEYVTKDQKMTLHRVSVGDEPPLDATLATIVLGAQFPYEVQYDAAPPKNVTIDASKLLDRAELPPDNLPPSSSAGARTKPPTQATQPADSAPPIPGK